METAMVAGRLLSIALAARDESEVLLLTAPGESCPPGATPFASERDLLAAFAARVRARDPDVLTGWNVIDFDLAVLARLAARHGVRLDLGRAPGPLRVEPARFRWGASYANVPGRVVLDGIQLVRGAFITFDEYNLDFVARQVLGEGKLVAGPARHTEVQRLFAEDRARFVEYNRADARLVLGILDTLRLVPPPVERSPLTRMTLHPVRPSLPAFQYLFPSSPAQPGVRR